MAISKISRAIVGLFILSGVTGCAGTAGAPDYVKQKLAEKYLGKGIDAVVIDLGTPESTARLASGSVAYTWKRTTSKYSSNIFIKSDERCVITMLSDRTGKRMETIGKVDDSLGAYDTSYCAEQYEL
jgi:hypothetical protein